VCDLVVFVDDLRGLGPTVELTWKLSRVISSLIQYLGIQEASRKWRPPTRTPGAWAGGIFHTSATSVTLVNDQWKVISDAGLEIEGSDVSKL
jgi:hypothetical protein